MSNLPDKTDLSLIPVETLSREDQLALLGIRNQRAIRESSFQPHIIAEAEHFSWIDDLRTNASCCFYAFCRGREIIGGVGLKNINPEEGRADWSFYLSEDAHGRGLGLTMAVMALDRFFNDYPVTHISGETLEGNLRSQRFHKKLGFEETGDVDREVRLKDCGPVIRVFVLNRDAWCVTRQQLTG